MIPPVTLPESHREAFEKIAAYIRTLDRSRGRAVYEAPGFLQVEHILGQAREPLGFWQCSEWLQGLEELADECDRLAAPPPPAVPPASWHGPAPEIRRLADIPQRTETSQCYRVDIALDFMEIWLAGYAESLPGGKGLDLEPDFQRGHVWTDAQRSAFMEFVLAGGEIPPIWFNRAGDDRGDAPLVIVDGLQRLTTLRLFMRDEVRAYGRTLSEFEDSADTVTRRKLHRRTFNARINNLKTRREVLKWYLEINGGGTPHSASELARVKALFDDESLPAF